MKRPTTLYCPPERKVLFAPTAIHERAIRPIYINVKYLFIFILSLVHRLTYSHVNKIFRKDTNPI